MSKYTFPERKNTVNKNGVSLIVVTSPIPSHPDTNLIDEAIESVLKNELFIFRDDNIL